MKLSEFIDELYEIKIQKGDLETFINEYDRMWGAMREKEPSIDVDGPWGEEKVLIS